MRTAIIGGKTARRDRGFTILQTVMSTVLSGMLITGGWIAFADMRMQWHMAAAERMMDQYGAAVMQELTNDLSWGWGARMVQGGALTSRSQFVMDDLPGENGGITRWRYATDPSNFITLTVRPTRGILINGVPPKWSVDRYRNFYLWSGNNPPHAALRTFDRRDRMTVEGLFVEFKQYPQFLTSDPSQRIKWQGAVTVRLTVHYTYDASTWRVFGTRLYGDRWVRERVFSTDIFMRNWDVESNEFRDNLFYTSGGAGG